MTDCRIDTGTAKGSEVVAANIASLGFKITDVKALLGSHEHFDHVSGMARLQQASGAPVLVGAGAVDVIRTGKRRSARSGRAARSDGVTRHAIRAVADGEQAIAGVQITGIATPGHTIGAMSWQWESCKDGARITIVYADG